jgi:hypothetical protein
MDPLEKEQFLNEEVCMARRMAETAAHIVDTVIPNIATRQWVLSLPTPPALFDGL